jgi:hypothetical protein
MLSSTIWYSDIGIILSILVVVFVAFTLVYWKTPIGSNERFTGYINSLGVIGALMAIIFGALQIRDALRSNIISEGQLTVFQTDYNWSQIERIFIDNAPNLNRLYKQIYSNDLTIKDVSEPPITSDIILKEAAMSSIIIQAVDNIVTYLIKELRTDDVVELASRDNTGWTKSFISWFKSPIIREVWKYRKNFYDVKTIEYVEKVLMKS